MNRVRTYRCFDCQEGTIEREFDVSHVSTTCPACDEFGRLVNERVFEQFRAFEESPPETIAWDSLDRRQKFAISERVARTDRSIEDFSTEE